MKCAACKKNFRPGEHVFPCLIYIKHVECGSPKLRESGTPAVIGSDGRMRWVKNGKIDTEWSNVLED